MYFSIISNVSSFNESEVSIQEMTDMINKELIIEKDLINILQFLLVYKTYKKFS